MDLSCWFALVATGNDDLDGRGGPWWWVGSEDLTVMIRMRAEDLKCVDQRGWFRRVVWR